MQAGFLGSCKKGAVRHLFCLFACFLDWVYNANMKKKVVKKDGNIHCLENDFVTYAEFRELENRVAILESMVLPKARK